MRKDSRMEDRELNDDLFRANKRESAVDYVINVLKEALITDKLQPGDRLPSETELSNRLAISRGSIREAMKILSAFGIVEIKRGNGTYIAKSEHKVVFDPLLFSLILSKANMREFVELRELMEVAIVKLIINNADDRDLENIEKTINDMENMIKQKHENQPEQLTQSDLSFHRALGKATKNRIVEKIYDFLMDFFAPSIKVTHERQEKGNLALKDHQKIYRTLLNRNLEEAVDQVEKSIAEWKLFISNESVE
jgi:GntR family transcriptional repressor for pyruvate dehydrogenase complex